MLSLKRRTFVQNHTSLTKPSCFSLPLAHVIFAAAIFGLMAFPSVCAQNAGIDSLRQAIASEKLDVTRAELMLKLMAKLEAVSFDSVIVYGPRVVDACQRSGYTKGAARALSRMAVNYYYKGDNLKAIELYEEVYRIASAAGDKGMMSTNRNNIGVLYQRRGEYDKAIAALNEAVKLSEETAGLNGSAGIPRIHLGTIMRDGRHDYPAAIAYYTQAIAIFEADTAFDRYYLAYSYHYIGVTYALMDMTDRAIGYQLKGLQLYRLIGDTDGEAEAYTDLTDAYLRAKEYEKALVNVEKAIALAEKSGYGRRIAEAHIKKGQVLCARKEFALAIASYKKAEELATTADAKPVLRDACQGLAECYKALKQKDNQVLYESRLSRVNATLEAQMPPK